MSLAPARLLVSAGEISGDRLAAKFVKSMRYRSQELLVAGCGGQNLQDIQSELWLDQKRINFVGWTGPARHILRLWLDQRKFLAKATHWNPDAVLLVDSPGWNRPILKWAMHRSIPVHWLAPPQLWAWKRRPATYLDSVSVQPLFAFEIDALRNRGARVCWHGLPRESAQLTSGDGSIALLPGTRKSLWERHLPLFAKVLHATGRQGIVAVATDPDPEFAKICQSLELRWELSESILSRASASISVPGTGCLVSVRHGVPTLVVADPGPVDTWLASRLLTPGSKSLPNRILDRRLVDECYGPQATAPILAKRLDATILRRPEFQEALSDLEARLGPEDEFPVDPW